MARIALSPGRLYSLLNAEYKGRRSPDCRACQMPLPFLTERPDAVSANWRIGTPPPCEHGCHTLISEIAASAWPAYDLLDPFSRPRQEREQVSAVAGNDVPEKAD